jgi:hypothetical protein
VKPPGELFVDFAAKHDEKGHEHHPQKKDMIIIIGAAIYLFTEALYFRPREAWRRMWHR